MPRRLTLTLLLALSTAGLLPIALACGGGGGGGGGGCSPAFDDACVCADADGVTCDPDVTFPCSCTLEDNNPANNSPNNNSPNNNPNNSPDGNNASPPSPDNAGLTFVATYPDGARLQLPSNPRGFIPTFTGDGHLVVLLCAMSDPTCEAPVWIGAPDRDDPEQWSASGSSPAPIQGPFGPTITLRGLPAGTFRVMIAEDSAASRARGKAWTDGRAGAGRPWGGVVSTMDLLLSDQDPDVGFNPPPAPREVTLTADNVTDLGTIDLGHFYEEDISPTPQGEEGLLVVASSSTGGLRLIDLERRDLLTAPGGGLDHVLLDADGDPVEGTICNLLPGPDDLIWVLFAAPEGSHGHAVLFDPRRRALASPHRVTFPAGGADGPPCRGAYAERGGQGYLFLVGAGSSADRPRRGLWYANVTDLASQDIQGALAQAGDDPLWGERFAGVQVHEDTLLVGSFASLPGCNDDGDNTSCVFQADFDATTGAPSPRRLGGGDYDVLRTNTFDGPVPRAGIGETRCSGLAVAPAYFGMKVARFHKTGHDLLFIANCLEIHAFDLDDGGRPLDFDPASAGVQGFDASFYGAGFYDLQLDPEGQTLYAAPINKSVYPFFVDAALPGEEPFIIDTDRHTLVALDLSAEVPGQLPAADPRSSSRDQDGYSGVPDYLADLYLPTEAPDPGIDLRAFYVRRDIYTWDRDLAGSVPIPTPNAPTLAVTRHTVWLRGAGSESTGNSGLGWGSNLLVLDLDAQEMVLFPRGDAPFHRVFQQLGEVPYGFELAPDAPRGVSTAGVIFVP